MSNIYFVRHGESEANANGHLFGLDMPLTDKGIEQALFLRDYFKEDNTCLVVCSAMRRAVSTALLAFPDKNVFCIDRRFNEINFGFLEGLPADDSVVAEIQQNPDAIQSKYHGDFIWQRAIKAIQALTDYVNMAGNNMNVVLVGHDTLFEVMLQKIGYYEKANGVPFVLWSDNCKFLNGNVLRINMDTFKDLQK